MKLKGIILLFVALCSLSFVRFGTKVQVQNQLETIKQKFKDNNHRFSFHIFKRKQATLKVIHGEMIPAGSQDFSMYCLLSFDPKMDLEDEYNRFKRSGHISKFKLIDQNGVPCYYRNIGLNTEESSQFITALLEDVYLVQIFDKLSFQTIDEGKVIK